MIYGYMEFGSLTDGFIKIQLNTTKASVAIHTKLLTSVGRIRQLPLIKSHKLWIWLVLFSLIWNCSEIIWENKGSVGSGHCYKDSRSVSQPQQQSEKSVHTHSGQCAKCDECNTETETLVTPSVNCARAQFFYYGLK